MKQTEQQLDVDGMPTYLPELTAENFLHGSWGNTLTPYWECGSRFCAVGQCRAAFGLDPRPENDATPALLKFMRRYLFELTGSHRKVLLLRFDRHVVEGRSYNAQVVLSDCFEGTGFEGGARPITARKAAEAWNRTIKYFGYTVDAPAP